MGFLFIDNKSVDYESIDLTSKSLSQGSEVSIVHLSDIHFPQLKVDREALLKKIEDISADMTVITGDLIDDGANIENSGVYEFIDRLVLITSVFYVNGNHEGRNKGSSVMYEKLASAGVNVLMNRAINMSFNESRVLIVGLSDNSDYTEQLLDGITDTESSYRILLAHRPEKWKKYIENKDIAPHLVLAGHAHGGQFRFFNRGIIAPNQGLFPSLTSGKYTDGESTLVVSRGLGNSFFPFRFNNKPHVPLIRISN